MQSREVSDYPSYLCASTFKFGTLSIIGTCEEENKQMVMDWLLL